MNDATPGTQARGKEGPDRYRQRSIRSHDASTVSGEVVNARTSAAVLTWHRVPASSGPRATFVNCLKPG